MSEIAKHIGQLIREARKAKGVTQTELAEKLNISQAAVNRYEAGTQNLTIDTIQKIATALGSDINVTFKG